MARRIEQGSVLGFVLVGAVLVGLLAGGIYVVRHMQSSSDTTTMKPATPNKDDKNTADSGSSAPAKPSTSSDDQLKAALDSQAKDNSKKTETASNPDTSSSSTSGSSSTSSASALPKTGPEQLVAPMLGAALLVASVVSYTRSRRLI